MRHIVIILLLLLLAPQSHAMQPVVALLRFCCNKKSNTELKIINDQEPPNIKSCTTATTGITSDGNTAISKRSLHPSEHPFIFDN